MERCEESWEERKEERLGMGGGGEREKEERGERGGEGFLPS